MLGSPYTPLRRGFFYSFFFGIYVKICLRAVCVRFFFIGVFMADKSIVLSVIERNWLKKCIDLQVKSLIRSKGNEMPDSPVVQIRDQEISILRGVEAKL